MPKTYKIHMLLETLSPLTHMMGTNGNEALINREAVLYKDEIRHLPVISGNAIRHKLIREPGAMFIIGACNLAGKMNIDQLNYLFNGGSLVESSVSCNIRKIADMQSILPLYRLLGGCLKNQVVSGSLNVHRGMLICRENAERISSILPQECGIEAAIFPAERFIDQYQYTRGDAKRMKDVDFFAAIDELNTGEEKEKSNLMIFNGQTIVAGTLFYLGFVLNNVSDLELGALFHSLSRWNCFIGGQGSRGHGRCKISIIKSDEMDIPGLVEAYKAHIMSKKEEIKAWLTEAFPTGREEKLAKKAKAQEAANAEKLALDD
jgi:CRISPR/Cas system CSM-associated protein Csm3 (group 7 of RAMP superfamily)